MARHSEDSTSAGHMFELVKQSVPPMHPGGRPIVAAAAAGSLLVRWLLRRVGLKRLGSAVGRIGLGATAGTALFFREPQRVTPADPSAVVSAADGLVALVDEAAPPAELGLGTDALPRVSVFLSVLDVHVQRAPVTGVVVKREYRPGKFLSADLDKASEDNERNSLLIGAANGQQIVVVQIAGLLARRIVCDVDAGSQLIAGRTYGLIRFGSRVDVYLPAGTEILVSPGQRMVGGETVLARLQA